MLVVMFFVMGLDRLLVVMLGMELVGVSELCMMRSLLVMAVAMMLCCFFVVLCSVFVMLSGFRVMVFGVNRHRILLERAFELYA